MRFSVSNLLRISIVVVAAVSIPAIADDKDDDHRPGRPKEAAIETVVDAIDPGIRTKIGAKLTSEIETVEKKLTAQREGLTKLREELKQREKEVRQLDLKLQFLKDRRGQWSVTGEDESESKSESQDDESQDDESQDDESQDKAESKDEAPKP